MERKSIGQVSEASGVSRRTLRYYEDLGLLCPARTDSGYRWYSEADERRLSQIMAMRACQLPLSMIVQMLEDPDADIHAALCAHLQSLRAQSETVEVALQRTQAAIKAIERIRGMKTEDAFEALKREGLEAFEETYGQEARERYGDDVIDETNARMLSLTKDEWEAKELLEESIKVQLRLAMASGAPDSPEAQELSEGGVSGAGARVSGRFAVREILRRRGRRRRHSIPGASCGGLSSVKALGTGMCGAAQRKSTTPQCVW